MVCKSMSISIYTCIVLAKNRLAKYYRSLNINSSEQLKNEKTKMLCTETQYLKITIRDYFLFHT